jgi:hypothetical protein
VWVSMTYEASEAREREREEQDKSCQPSSAERASVGSPTGQCRRSNYLSFSLRSLFLRLRLPLLHLLLSYCFTRSLCLVLPCASARELSTAFSFFSLRHPYIRLPPSPYRPPRPQPPRLSFFSFVVFFFNYPRLRLRLFSPGLL